MHTKCKTEIREAAQCRCVDCFWYELKPLGCCSSDPAGGHLVYWLTLLKVLHSQDGTKNTSLTTFYTKDFLKNPFNRRILFTELHPQPPKKYTTMALKRLYQQTLWLTDTLFKALKPTAWLHPEYTRFCINKYN